MTRSTRTVTRQTRALRGALAVAVLAGYLAAWGGTSAGHGWRLAPHLALDHARPAVPAAPHVLGDTAPGLGVLPTLRPDAGHTHGGRAHSHGHGEAHGHAPDPDVFPAGRPVLADDTGGLHEHDGVLHSHREPPPEPAVLVTVAVDKHRLPATPVVPAPPPPTVADLGDGTVALESIGSSVETPPPIRRG
ncbi:hypothetical protein [Rubrivirga sp.]|uniref:hypothetical protein n=1 Tax=Rubrivirga sp. TaxID=1885344 RepID=UPI003B5283BB